MPFTIIGELLNTSRPGIQKAVAQRDSKTIQQLVKSQEEKGATYIDINTGAGIQTENQDMQWPIHTVQAVAKVPLCIDSPDPHVLASAWDILDRPPMINSISLEKNRIRATSCAGIELLLVRSGVNRVDHTILTGAFGAGFDCNNAVTIGLLPKLVQKAELTKDI